MRELWLPLLSTLCGAALLTLGGLAHRRGGGPAWAKLVFGGILLCFGVGGLVPSWQFGSVREPLTMSEIGLWIALAAARVGYD